MKMREAVDTFTKVLSENLLEGWVVQDNWGARQVECSMDMHKDDATPEDLHAKVVITYDMFDPSGNNPPPDMLARHYAHLIEGQRTDDMKYYGWV